MSRRLDSIDEISKVDAGNMLEAINKFPYLLRDTSLLPEPQVGSPRAFDNIVLVGMGGSGSASDVLSDWLTPRLEIPLLVIRDSILPRFAGKRTMVMAISYSGETRETVTAFGKAARRDCKLAGVGSGGRLATLCDRLHAPFLQVPRGLVPRAALSPMLGASAALLESFGIVRGVRTELREAARELVRVRDLFRAEVPSLKNLAKQAAVRINGEIPSVYCLQRMSSVARRAKNQFAENSKAFARYELLPEAGHNEIVPWETRNPRALSILVRDAEESRDEGAVLEAFKKTLTRISGTRPLEVRTRTVSSLGRVLGPILFFDYVSFYLACLDGVDPSSTRGIQQYRRLLSIR